MDELTKNVKQIIETVKGDFGIVIKDINEDKVWMHNENTSFYAASVIKLPIMATVYLLAEQNKFKLSDTLVIRKEDMVEGMGVLQHLTPNTELSILDLTMLMIIQSDNTATNLLIDLVSIEKVQFVLKDLCMINSKFYHKMMTVPVSIANRNSITPLDVNRFLERLLLGQIVSKHACEQMISILKKQQIRTSLPAIIENDQIEILGSLPTWEIACKTGRGYEIHHDAGIFYVGNRVMTVTVLSKGCDFIDGPTTIAKIGKEIHTYLSKTQIYK